MRKKLLLLALFFLWAVPVSEMLSQEEAFAQSVDTAWVRRYNGAGNGNDEGRAIAVDGSGNVYVTGYSSGTETSSDYTTIKYYPNGDTAWVRTYNGPGNYLDVASDVAIDDSGNVYVTGESYGTASYYDYAAIKYYPNGDIAWVRRYNGPSNLSDQAFAIAVDDSGNIYITGFSVQYGASQDFLTVKYSSNGDTSWVRRYNGPGNSFDEAYDIAVDHAGNVYVTGGSIAGPNLSDCTTIKYYSNGDTAWVRRYHGPAERSWDWTKYLALDDSGNVYVTGKSADSRGWDDYITIKYYANGDTAWMRRYNGPANGYDEACAIDVDSSGNAYVTGRSHDPSTDSDYVTIKYDPQGDELWVKRYNGPENSSDKVYGIRVDGSNNICVAGYSHYSITSKDYGTVRYDSLGNQLWVKRYNGPGNSSDEAYAIAVDASGNFYVTGESYGSGTGSDYATIKYVQFLRGDVNNDGSVSLSDVSSLINYLFEGGPAPDPIQSGDANCDGTVTISDCVYLINYLFKGGPAPGC